MLCSYNEVYCVIHWWFLMSWQKFVVLGTNLHPHYVPIPVSTYSYLRIDILHIDVYKEIYCMHVFHSSFLLSHSKGYTQTVPQTNPGLVKYSQQNVTMDWPFCLIPKAFRLRVVLGMLKISPAFAKSICPLFTEDISERMALDPHENLFVFLI